MEEISNFFTTPSLGAFGQVLSRPLGAIISLIWFICLTWAVVALLTGFASLNKAKNQYQADKMASAKDELMWPVISLIGLLIVPSTLLIFPQFIA